MRLRGAAKYIVYNYLPTFRGKLPYYGTDIHFQSGSPLIRQLCLSGNFEPDVIQALMHFATYGTVFDVGANIGLMAAPILHANPAVKIVCFEPSPAVAALLARSISESPYKSRWELVEKAVSDRPGNVQLIDEVNGDPLFGRISGNNDQAVAGRTSVEATTLDLEWKKRGSPPVSVVKIDVEGAEPMVLGGAKSLISSCRPVIVTEWHSPYLARYGVSGVQLLDFARELRYGIFAIPQYIPAKTSDDLRVLMMPYSNFVLVPAIDGQV